jgi:hypothetical protein
VTAPQEYRERQLTGANIWAHSPNVIQENCNFPFR